MTPAEIISAVVTGIASILAALFGWLKLRDQARFTAIEERFKEYESELANCHNERHQLQDKVINQGVILARCEERLRFTEQNVRALKKQLKGDGDSGIIE